MTLATAIREALDRGDFDGVPYDPAATPLQDALGSGWIVVHQRERMTSLAMHRESGVWAELTIECSEVPRTATLCATALHEVVMHEGRGGQYVITATRHPDGRETAVAERLLPAPRVKIAGWPVEAEEGTARVPTKWADVVRSRGD